STAPAAARWGPVARAMCWRAPSAGFWRRGQTPWRRQWQGYTYTAWPGTWPRPPAGPPASWPAMWPTACRRRWPGPGTVKDRCWTWRGRERWARARPAAKAGAQAHERAAALGGNRSRRAGAQRAGAAPALGRRAALGRRQSPGVRTRAGGDRPHGAGRRRRWLDRGGRRRGGGTEDRRGEGAHPRLDPAVARPGAGLRHI